MAEPGATSSRPEEPPRHEPLVAVAAAAGAGILADRFAPLALGAWWAVAAAAWLVWLIVWHRRWLRAAAVVLLVSVAATAASWHHCRWSLFPADDLGFCAQGARQPVCIEATVLRSARVVSREGRDPLWRIPAGTQTRVELAVARLRDGAAWQPASGRVELSVQGALPGPRAGDRLRVFADLWAPARPASPGQWDYAGARRADRRHCLLRAQHAEGVETIAAGSPWSPHRIVDAARLHGSRFLARHLASERARLAAAILLGDRTQLEPGVSEAFVETGTVHLLVVSGLNVGILAAALWFVLRRLAVSRPWSMAAVVALTVFYMVVTGAEPPVVRATVLVLGACFGLALGRRALEFNSLAAAALVVLAANPCDLFNVGTQLSFLCVAGLTWFGLSWFPTAADDPLQRELCRLRPWPARIALGLGRATWRIFLAGTLLWLLVLPLVMARFHLVTLVAPVLNAVLWLPVEVAMTSGFVVLLFGWVPGLGTIGGAICDGSLWLLQAAVDAGHRLPGVRFWVPGPTDWWLAGFYGGMALLAACPRLRPRRRWCLALLALWVTCGFAAAGLHRGGGQLRCTFLPVKHGCAAVLELPSGQTVLYDAGQMGSPVAAGRTIAEYLWSRGRTHLDAVVLSHPDVDHYNALPDVLERFSVGAIYVSPVMFDELTPALAALREAIDRSGVPVREIYAGDRLRSDPCSIEVLHPPRLGVLGSDNANSLVLGVEYQGRRILLPGDLDSPGLEGLLAEEPWRCAVLLAPHHGSRRSHPLGLVQWSGPGWVVTSGSDAEDLAAGAPFYRAHGARPLHTARHGAITAAVDAARDLSVRGFVAGPDEH